MDYVIAAAIGIGIFAVALWAIRLLATPGPEDQRVALGMNPGLAHPIDEPCRRAVQVSEVTRHAGNVAKTASRCAALVAVRCA